jgi:hypothetical protein
MIRSILLGILLLASLPGVAAAQDAPQLPPPEPPSEPIPPQVPPPQPENVPPEPTVQPPGRSCRSRSDCDPMRCLRNTCVDQATFLAERAVANMSTLEPKPDESARVFFGGAFGAPLPVVWNSQVGVGLQAAARFGVLVSHVQFQLEVSPASTVLFGVNGKNGVPDKPMGMFEAAATVAYLVPLNPYASWILRAGGGGGFTFAGVPKTTGFGEVRFDVVGVAIRTSEHVLLELNAPSVRVLLPTGGVPTGVLFVTNVGFAYVY